jgi:hypothetical protein
MAWCEANCVDHVFGLARNDRLAKVIEAEMSEAAADCQATGRPKRRFKDLLWSTIFCGRRSTAGAPDAGQSARRKRCRRATTRASSSPR